MARKVRKQPEAVKKPAEEAAKKESEIVLKRQRGVVKSYNKDKGFGYITTGKKGQEKELYFMKASIKSEVKVLGEGEKVLFMIGLGITGRNENVALDITRDTECFTCGKGGHAYTQCPTIKQVVYQPQRRSPSVSSGDGCCYYCKEPGHIARDCPKKQNQSNGNSGGRSDGTCYYCKEPGHMARECPKKRNQSNGNSGRSSDGICYNCLESGHMKRDCTQEKVRPQKPKPRACYICHQPGHIAKDCQQQQTTRRSNGNADGSGEGICYNCEEPGHMARYCDQPCRNCNQMGHMPKNCPGPKVGGGQNNKNCFECSELGHLAIERPNKGVKQSNERS